MKIRTKYASLLRHSVVQALFTAYYKHKFKRPCFLLEQNSTWTVVTYQ